MPHAFTRVVKPSQVKEFIADLRYTCDFPGIIETPEGHLIDIQHAMDSIPTEAFIMTEKYALEEGWSTVEGSFSPVVDIPTIKVFQYQKNKREIEELISTSSTYLDYEDAGDDIETSERIIHVREKILRTLISFICRNQPSMCSTTNNSTSRTSTSSSQGIAMGYRKKTGYRKKPGYRKSNKRSKTNKNHTRKRRTTRHGK